MPRLLHLSDLHFGKPSVTAQVQAVELIVATEQFDAIVISGDLTQRARTAEMERARAFVAHCASHAPTLTIPGNHDVRWWWAPFGLGSYRAMFGQYRRFINPDIEPVLRVPGVTIVALNSAHGIQPWTLTTRPRDLSVVGAVRARQWERARRAFNAAPADDVRVLVIHHNLLRGRLSDRWGLANRARGIEQAAATGADLVLCGHDHEARIEQVEAGGHEFVVSTPNTLTDRVRGGAPALFHMVEVDAERIAVEPWVWGAAPRAFYPGRPERFTR